MSDTMSIDEFHIERIDTSKARDFIKENHYSHTCHNGPMAWGIYHTVKWTKTELVGVIAFATPISENVRKSLWKEEYVDEMKDKTTELHRLVTLDKCPKNTESWFISRVLDRLKEERPKYKAVISFADSTEGHKGKIYQATNAIYYGTTGEHNFYREPSGVLRPPRISGENISQEEAESRGWEVEKRGEKHRYLFLLPDKYEKVESIKKKLDIEEKKYP